MRPLSLRVSGLHGYREPVEVDFEQLGAYGLFGIFGPVGSGKSTLLDAITLALYGVVDRVQGRARRGIVNAGSTRLSVRFCFALSHPAGGEIAYAVERHYRPDEHGVAQRTSSRLLRSDTGAVLADKERDVQESIVELVGLTAEDFLRAVVLPQGRFMELLHLRGEQRRSLLQRLFGLERFGEGIRSVLRSREIELEKRLEHGQGELVGLGDLEDDALSRAAERLQRADEGLAGARTSMDRAADALRRAEALSAAEDRVSRARIRVDQVRARDIEVAARRDELARAMRLASLAEPFRRHGQARLEADLAATAFSAASTALRAAVSRREAISALADNAQEARADQGPTWRSLVQSLERDADAAVRWESAERDARKALATAQRAQRVREEASAAAATAEALLLQHQRARDTLAARWAKAEVDNAERVRSALASAALADAEAANRGLNSARIRWREAAAEHDAAGLAWQTADAVAADLRAHFVSLGDAPECSTEDAQRIQDQLDQLNRLVADDDRECSAAKADAALVNPARAAVSEATAYTARRRSILRDAERTLEEAENATGHAASAAHLASSLKPGSPCPVCGSCAHPAPAPAPDSLLDAAVVAHQQGRQRATERLDTAAETESLARSQLAVVVAADVGAQRRVSASAARLRVFIASTSDLATAPDLRMHLAHRAQIVGDAVAARARRDQALRQLEQAEAPLAALRARLDAAEHARARAQADHELAEAASERAWARLDAERIDRPIFDLHRQLRAIEDQNEQADTLKEQLDELERQLADARRSRDRCFRDEQRKRVTEAEATARSAVLSAAAPDAGLPTFDPSALPKAQFVLDALESACADTQQQLTAAFAEEAAQRVSHGVAEARHHAATAVDLDRTLALESARARAGIGPEEILPEQLAPLDDRRRAEIEATVTAHAEESGRAALVLAEAYAHRQGLPPAPPLAEANAEHQEAAARFERAVATRAAIAAERDAVATRAPRLAILRQEVAAVTHRLGTARALTALLRGNRFVDWLAEGALGDLVARASEHLRALTEDRYSLGLEEDAFVVSDADAGGAERPVGSLSGGETFLASLALALALSAQVAARGHRPLDFFFLDEGFGSLDPDALDRALTAIEALPRGRRVVGVVSHVAAVRDRVPRWLEVTPATRERGARVRMVDS